MARVSMLRQPQGLEELRALAAAGAQADFLKWLRDSREELRNDVEREDADQPGKRQASRMLGELITHLTEAQGKFETLLKMEQAAPRE